MNYPAQPVKSFALLSKGLDAMLLAAKLQHGLGARIVICCTMLPAVVLMKEGKNLFVAWATWPGKQSWWILPQSRIIFQTLPGRCKAEYSATIWMAISLVAFHEFQPCCTFGIILKFVNSVYIYIYISYARCDMIFFYFQSPSMARDCSQAKVMPSNSHTDRFRYFLCALFWDINIKCGFLYKVSSFSWT